MRIRAIISGMSLLLVSVLITILAAGCAGGKTDTSQPPQIPPESTFVIDFSDFTGDVSSFNSDTETGPLFVSLFQEATPVFTGPSALGDRSNWTFAALNVGFWNLAVVVGMAVPVASFAGAIHQVPVKQPDNSWVWTYSVTVQGVTYTAELHGKYINSGVRWDMYISKQSEFTDFLWYYGESNKDVTRGYWVLKEKPSSPNDLLRIDWERDPANETGSIKYTNIVPGGAENGGYISFTVSREEPYDRFYTIFNKGKNETTYIEWNFSSKAGRVKDSVHFGDNNWHYWNSDLMNTTGP